MLQNFYVGNLTVIGVCSCWCCFFLSLSYCTDLPKAAIKILSNMTFLFVSLSYTAESAIVTAFITFIPKFIESQFGIPASSASIYTGTCFHRNSYHYINLFLLNTFLHMITFLVISHIAHGLHSAPHIIECVKNEMWRHAWYFFSQLWRLFWEGIFDSFYIKLYMLLWVCITGSQDTMSLLLIYINPQKHIALYLRLHILIKPCICQNIS